MKYLCIIRDTLIVWIIIVLGLMVVYRINPEPSPSVMCALNFFLYITGFLIVACLHSGSFVRRFQYLFVISFCFWILVSIKMPGFRFPLSAYLQSFIPYRKYGVLNVIYIFDQLLYTLAMTLIGGSISMIIIPGDKKKKETKGC